MNAQSVSYTGDGNTAVYLFPFLIEETLDLEILVNGITQNSGYAILGGEGANIGGAVRFDTAPSNGSAIILRRTGKVQVSPTDAPGFLEAKLAAGSNVTITPSSDASGQHLIIAATIDTSAFLSKSQNLADLPNTAAARANLGLASVAASGSYTDLSNKPTLGSAAAHAASDFATVVQGAKADSALQSSDIGNSVQAHGANLDWVAANLSTAGKALIDDADAAAQRVTLGLANVAASGAYADLSNKPSLGSAAALNLDTDVTLAANSDALLPSQKAVKAYVDAVVLAPQSPLALQEKQLLRQALSSAVSGNTAAEPLFNGLCDAFNSDTIGATSTNQAYDTGAKLYSNAVNVYGAGLIPDMTSNTTPNGVASESSTQAWAAWQAFSSSYWGANGSGGMYTNSFPAWLQYQFPTAQTVNKYIISANSGYRWPTAWQFQGSNNGTSWTTLHTVTGNPAVNGQYSFAFPNASAYTYYRLYVTGGADPTYLMIDGLRMFAAQTWRDMTLVSSALSPSSAPSVVKLMVLYKDQSASAVLNTDFTAEASRDGTTWTVGTLSDTGLTLAGFKVLWVAIDVSGQPSGTSVKYRLKTLNTKPQLVKGVAMMTA